MKKDWGIAIAFIALAAGAWWVYARPGRRSPAMTVPVAASAPVSATEETDVTIPHDSLDRLHLRFGQVTEGRLPVAIRIPGTVQSNGYREVHVTPLVAGNLLKVSAELGQTVKRGQSLAQVFSTDLTDAQMGFISFKAELDAEHKKLMRTQQLVQLGAASREELETVEANHHVHQAHVDAARQKLLLLGLTEAQIDRVDTGRRVSSNIDIPAPIDGVVIARSANPGQVVALGQELFTVTDLSTVWVEGSLFEKDFAAVRVGSQAAITTPAYAGRTYGGTVSYIDPLVDAQTRTAKVRVVVANPQMSLRLGMFMDMSFTTSGSLGLLVPRQAVQSIGAEKVVYLPAKGEEGRFLQRTVKVGEELDGGFRVLEGLLPGERVVTDGSFSLRAEALRQHAQ